MQSGAAYKEGIVRRVPTHTKVNGYTTAKVNLDVAVYKKLDAMKLAAA